MFVGLREPVSERLFPRGDGDNVQLLEYVSEFSWESDVDGVGDFDRRVLEPEGSAESETTLRDRDDVFVSVPSSVGDLVIVPLRDAVGCSPLIELVGEADGVRLRVVPSTAIEMESVGLGDGVAVSLDAEGITVIDSHRKLYVLLDVGDGVLADLDFEIS